MAFDPGAPVGNTSLTQFDAVIIGSGAGGGSIAHILTKSGLKVLVLEAGPNWFQGLDDPKNLPVPLFSNDELKLNFRNFIKPKIISEPRTFRQSVNGSYQYYSFANDPPYPAQTNWGDVNGLPRHVGGGSVHADLKMPRFRPTDFQLGTLLGDQFNGTNFANWPTIQNQTDFYTQIEPYYAYAEKVIGVQGRAGAVPGEGARSTPFPMAPGVEMYCGKILSDGLTALGYTPFPYPTAVNSQNYNGRPACCDCGMCSGYGCPSNAKGSAAVTVLRNALLTNNCLLLPQRKVLKLTVNNSGTAITGVQVKGPDGTLATYTGDRYILAASPVEDARLLWLSGNGSSPIGNASGQVGQNLMFHRQTICIGIFPQRIHGHRGRAVTTGFVDFRGDPSDLANHPLGGIVELSGSTGVIFDAENMSQLLTLAGGFNATTFKNLIRQSPLRDHVASMTMQAEDAPQTTNFVDLDPTVKDLDGLPASRVTYTNCQAYEEDTSAFYAPKMIQIMGQAGAKWAGVPGKDTPPQSAHVMGTLRFGSSAATSVCDPTGKFHDIGNLWAADGALFPTSAGFNPTMTIMTLSMFVGANIVSPSSPEQAIQS